MGTLNVLRDSLLSENAMCAIQEVHCKMWPFNDNASYVLFQYLFGYRAQWPAAVETLQK